MGLQRVGHDWATELNWTELNPIMRTPPSSSNHLLKAPSPNTITSGIRVLTWRILEEHKHLVLSRARLDFPGDSDGKASAYNAGDPGSIAGSGRSPGEGNSNPLQYSLRITMDRGAWWATVHGVTKSQIQLRHTQTHTHTHFIRCTS